MRIKQRAQVHTYIIVPVLICAFLAGSISVQPVAAATSLTTAQQTLLASLIAQLRVLQAKLAELQAKSGCPAFTRPLAPGMSGGDVSALQAFLARDASVYPERTVNGSFDAATTRAVERYQAKAGIVQSGTPATTGYGAVGPRTQAYITSKCVAPAGPQPMQEGDLDDGDLSLYDIELADETWDAGDTDINTLSFAVRNTSDELVKFGYRVTFTADDSADDEPGDITGTIEMGKDSSKETAVILEHDDFIDNGDYTIEVEIDAADDFEERSESNNTRSIDLSVEGINSTGEEEDDIVLSDLKVDHDEWDIEDDSTNNVSFTILNTFEDDETIEYLIEVRNDDTNVIEQSTRGTVRVDSFDDVRVSKSIIAANLEEDDYEVTVILDPDDDFDEERESNNENDIDFEVTEIGAVPLERVDLKIDGLDTPVVLDPKETAELSWNVQNVSNCNVTINRRPNGTSYYTKTDAVTGTQGTDVVPVTAAAPNGALSSVKLTCTGARSGTLSDYIAVTLPTTLGAYRYYEGSTLLRETSNLTEYDALAQCKRRARQASSTPWCGWNGGVIYGTKPAGWTSSW